MPHHLLGVGNVNRTVYEHHSETVAHCVRVYMLPLRQTFVQLREEILEGVPVHVERIVFFWLNREVFLNHISNLFRYIANALNLVLGELGSELALGKKHLHRDLQRLYFGHV